MQTKLKGFWEKIKGFFAKLNKKTRILLGVCAAVILVLIIAAALLLNRKEYATLCTGLTASETSTVIQFLNENGVTDYRISGDSILVPAGREEQLQVQLVTSKTLGSGFLYDFYTKNTGTFSTEAERKEALRIATQERLGSIIRQFDGVQDAWVDITLGTRQVYVLDPNTSQSTAAVTITPEGNGQLSAGVVEAIRYTVSHSVEELNIGSVSIVTTNGYTYNDTTGVGPMADANALKLQYEQEVNNKVRREVLEALEYIYGKGRVRVAVNTTVDMSRKVIEKSEYQQPEGALDGRGLIGTEKWFWYYGKDGQVQVGGTVGTPTNSDIDIYPDLNPPVDGSENVASGEGEREGKLDTTITQQEVLAGTISDISVAVTIDQKSENAGSMTVEQLTRHVAVASGIGTNLEGWDSHVSVAIAPFADDTPAPAPSGILAFLADLEDWVVYAAIAGVVLFFILLIIILLLRRRAKKKKLAKQAALEAEMRAAEEAAAAEAAAAVIAAAPTGGADIMEVNTEKSMELRKAVRQFAQNNPEIAAQMVKAWLKGEDTSA